MRVVALESLKEGIAHSYGEGEYIGDKVPDINPFREIGFANPCIRLDTGKYVWGFECWWGEKEEFDKQYGPEIKETIIVEPKNIQIYEGGEDTNG